MKKKKYTLGDRLSWWFLGFWMLIVSYLVQICIVTVPFHRKDVSNAAKS